MFIHGFPAPDKGTPYKIEDVDGQYQIAEKYRLFDIVLSMNHQMMLTELRLTSSDLEGVFRPRFSRQPKGYLLTALESSLTTKSQTAESAFTVEYQEVEGLELPKTVVAKAGSVRIPLNFSDYHIKTDKRQ